MSEALAPHAPGGAEGRRRLALALTLSAAAHLVVLLAVGFQAPRPAPPPPQSLDVVLVQPTEERRPEEADYLAQRDQEGAGNTRERVRPAAPPPAPSGPELPGQSERLAPAAAPPRPAATAELLTSAAASRERLAGTPERPSAPAPSAAELIRRSRELARLSAELEASIRAYSRRPRHRYLSARTRSLRDAAYLEAWRRKIERIGNLNYPEEARRRGLSGSLVLDVALNPDGSVRSVEILRSSGHQVLDDAAVRIVHLAAPFAPFPPAMRQDTDVLHIVRTWQFLDGDRLEAR